MDMIPAGGKPFYRDIGTITVAGWFAHALIWMNDTRLSYRYHGGVADLMLRGEATLVHFSFFLSSPS